MMAAPARDPPDTAWRRASGDLATTAVYALALGIGPWLDDEALLALVLGAALQLLFVTHFVAAIVPRSATAWGGLFLGHAALAGLIWLVLSRNGAQPVGWLGIALAQAPLLLRSLTQLARPRHTDGHWLFGGLGAFVVLGAALPLARTAAAAWPDPRLAARSIALPGFEPLDGARIQLALLFGVFFFLLMALGRALFGQRMLHHRSELDPATIARWRRDYARRGDRHG